MGINTKPRGVIAFDLDGTLWDSRYINPEGVDVWKGAWERLPHACRQVLGDIPPNFDWAKHAGSMDWSVVDGVVRATRPMLTNREAIVQDIMAEMDQFYLDYYPPGSKAALATRQSLYPDTKAGLEMLRALGYKFWIITGNSIAVTEAKLKSTGLYDFFSQNRERWFTGDRFYHRGEALRLAFWLQEGYLSKRTPLIYIADSIGDHFEARFEARTSHLIHILLMLRDSPKLESDSETLYRTTPRLKKTIFKSIGDTHFLEQVRKAEQTLLDPEINLLPIS